MIAIHWYWVLCVGWPGPGRRTEASLNRSRGPIGGGGCRHGIQLRGGLAKMRPPAELAAPPECTVQKTPDRLPFFAALKENYSLLVKLYHE